MPTDVLHFQKTRQYRQAVKGESNYQEHLSRAVSEDDLEIDLFLEDHNKFDKNAVAIVFETDTVGYLSREVPFILFLHGRLASAYVPNYTTQSSVTVVTDDCVSHRLDI